MSLAADAASDSVLLIKRLRAALLLLAGLTAVGAAAELAMLRHWTTPNQFVPWVLVALTMAATAGLAKTRVPGTISFARIVGLISAIGSGYGVIVHIASNYGSGVLDYRYADTWTTLPLVERLWLAATAGVGPTPPLAPGMLALGGIMLLLATLGYPTRRRH